MALNNTTFTALASGVRDLNDEAGAVYFLNGNASNGRLNVASSATVKFGDNSHVFVNGNSNHSYMNGVIEGTGLTYILKPSGGRADFGANNCGYKTTDVTFVLLGNGSLFHHLEDNRNLSKFQGFTRIIFNRSGGTCYIQFASKEYPNVEFQYKSGHTGTTNVYMARLTAGYTHLTGFKTSGLTSQLGIFFGSNSTSSGHIVDPSYQGVANNLLPIRVTGNNGANKRMYESFSIDVTTIRHDEAKIRVVDSDGVVLHNDIGLTEANTTPTANDGTTALTYFAGRAVVLCQVRRITTTQSTTRKQIDYTIRRLGYQDIHVDNLAMNQPIVLKEQPVDSLYSNSSNIDSIDSVAIAYDAVRQLELDDLTLMVASTINGTTWKLGNINVIRLALPANPTTAQITTYNAADALSVDRVSNTIVVKVGATADDYDAAVFDGSIDCGTGTFEANGVDVTGSINDSNGLIVAVSGLPATGVAGAWLKSQGTNNRAGIISARQSNGTVKLQLQADTEYYFVADAIGYARSGVAELNTTTQSSATVNLQRIKNAAGDDLVPNTLTAQEQQQVAMITFDALTFTAVVNATPALHNFTFNAIAYYVESVQSSAAFLTSPTTIAIRQGEFVLDPNSEFKLGASPDATATPDFSAFTFRKEGTTDQTDFVDFSNGALIVNSGAPVIVTGITVEGGGSAEQHPVLDKLNRMITDNDDDTDSHFDDDAIQSEFNNFLETYQTEVNL